MSKQSLPTEYAPAERASETEIQRQCNKLNSQEFIKNMLDAMPSMSMILNDERQIVFANKRFTDFFGFKSVGKRPGEAISCIHSSVSGGCGTSEFCQTCGAIESILESKKTDELVECECRMTRRLDGETSALDLRVWCHTMEITGEKFTSFSFLDISDEKRRHVLERIFFHDLMNTAGGIQGVSTLLMESGIPEEEVHELADLLNVSADELINEIQAQKTLSYAESGELKPVWESTDAKQLLERVQKQYRKHPAAEGKQLVTNAKSKGFEFITDCTLIRRVLGNLTKNGLEAVPEGNNVTLHCCQEGQVAVFTVQNAGVMPLNTQRQIFNRSFSTKGPGRGLGTYSIRLLVERYLNGSVSFISSEEEGTLFRVEVPLNPSLI